MSDPQPTPREKELTIEFLKTRISERAKQRRAVQAELQKEIDALQAKYGPKIEELSTKNIQDALRLEKITGETWDNFLYADNSAI